jgi:hypothetical protein
MLDRELASSEHRYQMPPIIPAHASIARWSQSWALHLGARPESREYLALIECWREQWRPQSVRILLIAESHVAEQDGDSSIRTSFPSGSDFPSGYCRLVYCLAYGENDYCQPRPQNNRGTIQYWDLFGAIVGGPDFKQPRKAKSTAEERLSWKLTVLKTMMNRGIWLVDASVAGMYLTGGKRLATGQAYRNMVRDSFDRFVWPAVKDEPLEQVWVIGKGTAEALDGHPAVNARNVTRQPQSRQTLEYQDELAYMSKRIRGDLPAPEVPVSFGEQLTPKLELLHATAEGCLTLVSLAGLLLSPLAMVQEAREESGGCCCALPLSAVAMGAVLGILLCCCCGLGSG